MMMLLIMWCVMKSIVIMIMIMILSGGGFMITVIGVGIHITYGVAWE